MSLDRREPGVVRAVHGANPVAGLLHVEVDVAGSERSRTNRVRVADRPIADLLRAFAGSLSTPAITCAQTALRYAQAVSYPPTSAAAPSMGFICINDFQLGSFSPKAT